MNTTMKTALLAVLLLFSLPVTVTLYGQTYITSHHPVFNPVGTLSCGSTRDFLPVSPSVASLGIFGQIPVGNYTGTAMVSIPLYEIKYKELSVPINLGYHASGIKPDIFPGPVGLGWTLQAGGCISRITRGNPDYEEVKGINYMNTKPMWEDPRSKENWNEKNVLEGYLMNPFFTRQSTTDPDEFVFNINGHTGKFMADHTDTLRVQSAEGGQFYVIPHFTYKTAGFEEIVLRVDSFTMIDMNGLSYDFTRQEITQPYKIDGQDIRYDGDIIFYPTSWLLTSIKSPNGYHIDFEYDVNQLITRHRFGDVGLYRLKNTNSYTAEPNFNYKDSEYAISYGANTIRRIVFPEGEIVFDHTSAVNQLYYPMDYNINHISKGFPEKIDCMRLLDSEKNQLKKIQFNYTNDTTTRLKLLSVNFYGQNTFEQNYRFKYNALPLPGYLSLMTDHYGYYNGKPFFNWPPSQDNDLTEAAFENKDTIFELKRPDFAYAQAEILEKVIYPTGGFTTFEYEAHDYSGIYRTWPFKVEQIKENKEPGGVRIRSITNFDTDHSILNKKTYHYRKNYLKGGTVSSGILAYTPKYIERYSSKWILVNGFAAQFVHDLLRWTTNPVFPLAATRGNHVTYSEVTVEEIDNGYTVSKYKNYDNGYPDKEPLGYASDILSSSSDGTYGVVEFWKDEEGISMALERGQLLSEEIYDAAKSLKKRITYTYNDDENRFNENVRYLRFTPTVINLLIGYNSHKVIAGVYYTYFPYLKEKTEETFLNSVITQKTEYTYHELFRLPKTESLTDSDSKKITKSYIYNFERLSDQPCYQDMVDKHMLAFRVEESLKKEGYNITTIRRTFGSGLSAENPELILLESEEKATGAGAFKYVRSIPVYDSYGNPNQIATLESNKFCILWSYNGQYPVAKIEGLNYLQVSEALTQEFISNLSKMGNPGMNTIESIRSKLSGLGVNVWITTYRYKPLYGIIYEIDPNGLMTSYSYDSFGRLEYIKDHDGYKTLIHQYHYKQQNSQP